MAIYLDCAATTPVLPQVREEMLRYIDHDFGNAGSRSHAYGMRARAAVERARQLVAAVAGVSRGDVVFTSGATESNNIAILGLAAHGEATGKKHVITTAIEHHAVLEPAAELERCGFEITRLLPDAEGVIQAESIRKALRPDTLLVSVMHVNNETGATQPIAQIAEVLAGGDAIFHVDAAQSFGKDILPLRNERVDLISASGHKLYAPKGIGVLITRRRNGVRPPVAPLMHGGGQERGLRPGTLPVSLIAAFGKAAELASSEAETRTQQCLAFRRKLIEGLAPLEPVVNGSARHTIPHIINLSIPAVDADTAIEAWQNLVAISQGAACTSQSYTCSHVLAAMRLPDWRRDNALRLSWSHFTPLPDFPAMIAAIERARHETRSVTP